MTHTETELWRGGAFFGVSILLAVIDELWDKWGLEKINLHNKVICRTS